MQFSIMNKKVFSVLLIVLVVLLASCTKEVPQTIEDVITKAGVPETIVSSSDSMVVEEEFDFASNWKCTTIEVDATEARGDYRTFDPNSEIIWPGNLLQGNSITKATPDPIVVERAGGTFTINLINGSNSMQTQASVEKVNQSNVVSALNKIISNNSGAIPANFTYIMQEVESREQLALAMGVNVSTLTTDVNAKLSFSAERSYNRFLVDFSQIYYTMIFEKPTGYDQVFAEGVTAEDLVPYMSESNPPVYISSVTFGRRFYLLIESTSSVDKMRASIKASYDAAVSSADFSVNATYVTDLDEVNIKIFAMGGDADAALGAFNGDLSALQSYLQDGGDYFKAAPLSYVMTSLAPPQKQVGIGVFTKFTIQNCVPVYDIAPPPFISGWYNLFNGGGIGAACAIDPQQNNVFLFNSAGTEYAVSQNGEIKGTYRITDTQNSHPLMGCPIDSVSVALAFMNGNLYFFDKDGLNWVMKTPTGNWTEPASLSTWGKDNTHPFREGARDIPGLGAACNWVDQNRAVYFDRTGQYYVKETISDNSFTGIAPLTSWGEDKGPQWSMPFIGSGVGVAVQVYTDIFMPTVSTGIVPPGKENHQVFFNQEGTKVAIYTGNAGFSPVYSLVPEETQK